MRWTEPTATAVPVAMIANHAAMHAAGEWRRDIYDSHRHHVYSVAYYMTGNEMEAEEILQTTFIQAFQSAVATTSGKPDIDQIDRALLTSLMQRFSFPLPLSTDMSAWKDARAANSAVPPQAPLGNVRRTELEEAVWGLPETERLFFLLRDVEGYTPERIAALVSWPVATVRETLHTARLHLRQQLSSRALAKA